MYDKSRIIGIIPARGGSKGIPKKNIKKLNGKPLIAYTINAALNSKYIDDTIVSTDDDKIAEISLEYGASVPFFRPAEISTDKSKTIETIIYTLDKMKKMGKQYDVLVILQPTSPLRDTMDINHAIEHFFESGCEGMASVSSVRDHPVLIRRIRNGKLERLLPQNSTCRRQDFEEYYRVNGAIYIFNIKEISEYTSFNDATMPFLMDVSHSVDIDTIMDFHIAELILNNND